MFLHDKYEAECIKEISDDFVYAKKIIAEFKMKIENITIVFTTDYYSIFYR